MKNKITIFTKPWADITQDELLEITKRFNIDGIELPIRDGFQITPGNIESALPQLSKLFQNNEKTIVSIAPNTSKNLDSLDENIFKICSQSNISIIRVMPGFSENTSYVDQFIDIKNNLRRLSVLAEKHNVTLGLQNHSGNHITTSMELYELVKPYSKNVICAVWDAGHSALAGENPKFALELLENHLGLVNFKSGCYIKEDGLWKEYWGDHEEGRVKYKEVIDGLKMINYELPICLTAQYSDNKNVDSLIKKDLNHIRSLMSL